MTTDLKVMDHHSNSDWTQVLVIWCGLASKWNKIKVNSTFNISSKRFKILFPEGANGDGMAIVTSLRSFDREVQKEFHIPIVIKDHGNPAMTGTSTLTVVVGDVNDNKMQPGSKNIFVYNYQGNLLSSERSCG